MIFKHLFLAAILSISYAKNAALPNIVSAQTSSAITTDGRDLLEKARSEIKNNHYREAIPLLEQALVSFENKRDLQRKIQVFKELGNCYLKLRNHSKAIQYFQYFLNLARQINYVEMQSENLDGINTAYALLEKYPEAIDYYQRTIKVARQFGNSNVEGNALGNLGSFYQLVGKYPEAIDYSQQAVKIARQLNNHDLEGLWLSNLGNIYRLLGKYPEAIDYSQQALKIAHQFGNRDLEGMLLGDLGTTYGMSGKYPESIESLQQALRTARQLNNRNFEGVVLSNLGGIYGMSGKYPEAIESLQQALKTARQFNNRNLEGAVLGTLGTTYGASGKYSEAIEPLQQAIKFSRQSGSRDMEKTFLHSLGFVYYRLRQLPTAIDYLQQSTTISDSLRTKLRDEDKITLFQTQIKSYKLLTAALLLDQNDLPASLIATERGRARAFSDLLSQRLETNSTISTLNTLDFKAIQTQARSRQATIVSYSILPDFDSPNNNQSYKLVIHIISSTGKLIVRESLIPKDLELEKLVNTNQNQLLSSRGRRGFSLEQLKVGMQVRLTGDTLETRRLVVKIDSSNQSVTLKSLDSTASDDVVKLSQIIALASAKTEYPELRQLHQLLIAPLADLLPRDPLAPVIFIPDGALYEVPFAALTNERGEYLIDL
jgi:tetratricopeptide (TPR) repeat protein